MKMIRDHGQAKKYYHDIEGYNGRLDSIQAGWLQRETAPLGEVERAAPRSARIATTNLFAEAKDADLPFR